MPARQQELQIGIGFSKQSALQTALLAPSLWSLRQNAFNPLFPQFNAEDDSEDFGKADDWAQTVFPTSIDMPWSWPYFLTSQNFAQVAAFGCGKSVKTSPGAGAFQYVCTPIDGVGDGTIELPSTTVVAGIRQGGVGEILDLAAVGMVCNSYTVRLQTGAGRQNSAIESQWVGCGKFVDNSGLTIPAAFNETRLGAGATTSLSINGVNYIANARFVDMTFTLENNIDTNSGFYPGSGSQSGYDIRGRLRIGKRNVSLAWQVELEAGSPELAALLAGTEGTIDIVVEGPIITGAIKHSARIQGHRTRHRAFSMAEAGGYVTARVETSFLKHASNGVFTLTAITNKDGIGEAAA